MRYVSAPPRAYYRDDYEGSVTADEVIDSGEHHDIDTGLVDGKGWPIYRTRDRVPFGFVGKERA